MTLAKMIADLLALKPREEFALEFDGGDEWNAHLVHPGHHGTLIEFGGVYQGTGPTAELAVQRCADAVRAKPTLDTDGPPDTRTEAQKRFDTYTDGLTDTELAHFYKSLQEAYPGELIVGFIRASAIVAGTLTFDTIKGHFVPAGA